MMKRVWEVAEDSTLYREIPMERDCRRTWALAAVETTSLEADGSQRFSYFPDKPSKALFSIMEQGTM